VIQATALVKVEGPERESTGSSTQDGLGWRRGRRRSMTTGTDPFELLRAEA